jgi:DNA-binding transcriptional LysR family regulator
MTAGVDLRALEIFLAVCEAGSMTGAAGRLGLSQAAVSQQIARLESDLGAGLIDRSVRPPRLLPAGALLRRRGQRLFGDVEELRQAVGRYRDGLIPELRLSIIESLATLLVPKLVPALRDMAGSVTVVRGTSGSVASHLDAGNVDIVVTSEIVEADDRIDSFTLLREPVIVVTPPGAPRFAAAADLALYARELPFLRYAADRRLGRLIDRHLARLGIELPRTLVFDSSRPMIDMVRQGAAWMITAPCCLLQARIEPGDVATQPFPGGAIWRRIHLVALRQALLDIPQRLAGLCVEMLEREARGRLLAFAPWAESTLLIGSEPRAGGEADRETPAPALPIAIRGRR